MGHSKTEPPAPRTATAPPAFLFVLATAVLMLMSAMEPRLALPLAAFVLMASLTWLLGKRLFRDLTDTAGRPG